MAPTVHVLCFATAREATGRSSLEWSIPPGGCTVGDVIGGLTARFPRLVPVVRASRIVKNGEYVGVGARVGPGDELGIHPPYSGG